MRDRNRCSCPDGSGRDRRCPAPAGPAAAGRRAESAPPSRCSALRAPNRNSRWLSRIWPQRGLPAAEQAVEAAEGRIVGGHAAQEALRRRSPRAGDARGCAAPAPRGRRRSPRAGWLRSRRSHGRASVVRSRRRVKRWIFSASTSLARATRTNSASFCSWAWSFSRSTSTWRSISDTVEPLRGCCSRRRASSCGWRSKKSGLLLQVLRDRLLLDRPRQQFRAADCSSS